MEEVVRARIDNETKKRIMIAVKATGETLSDVVRKALKEYAEQYEKNANKQ